MPCSGGWLLVRGTYILGMQRAFIVWFFALILVVMGFPMVAWSQPFLPRASSEIQGDSMVQRHPDVPSQSMLDTVAQDSEDQMVPAHGGLDSQGRPIWAHQVQRRQRGDTTLTFSGWVRILTKETAPRWWDHEAGAKQWTGMTEPRGTHRWRYQRYEDGWLVEQVGFYDQGQIDHHFHMKQDGRNVGSQRMWYPDGAPYLEQFHDENGALHGPQMRWSRKGILDLNLLFEHGQALDDEGRPLPTKGGQFSAFGGC